MHAHYFFFPTLFFFFRQVREAEIARCNYILVLGEEEAANSLVNVRTRGMYTAGAMPLDAFMTAIKEERDTYSREAAFRAPEAPEATTTEA